MKKTVIHLVLLALFTLVKTNCHAQALFENPFSDPDNVPCFYTFHVTNTGSGGGAFSPNTSTPKFGIIRHATGLSIFDIDKSLLLNYVLQETGFEINRLTVNFNNDFLVYNYETSTIEEIGCRLLYADNEYEKRYEEEDFIFCWIVNGRVWYCNVTTLNAIQYGDAYSYYEIRFIFDAYSDPYGIQYYDL